MKVLIIEAASGTPSRLWTIFADPRHYHNPDSLYRIDHVVSATRGEQAADVFHKLHPDLVVIDLDHGAVGPRHAREEAQGALGEATHTFVPGLAREAELELDDPAPRPRPRAHAEEARAGLIDADDLAVDAHPERAGQREARLGRARGIGRCLEGGDVMLVLDSSASCK